MISLSQMQLLEQRIESAIARISKLSAKNSELSELNNLFSEENTTLRSGYDSLKSEHDSLKRENLALAAKLNEFQANQSKIEQGILNALQRLEAVENTIIETVGASRIEEPAPAVHEPDEDEPVEQSDSGLGGEPDGEPQDDESDDTEPSYDDSRSSSGSAQLDIF